MRARVRTRIARASVCVGLACALAGAGSLQARAAGDPSGLWQTETGSSKVRLARCGAGFCGTLASVAGKGLDANNPDPALRGRSVVGVQIVDAPTPSGDGYTGTLYNPSDGKTYAGSLKLTGADTLEVSGCVLSLFCKRQTWRRVK